LGEDQRLVPFREPTQGNELLARPRWGKKNETKTGHTGEIRRHQPKGKGPQGAQGVEQLPKEGEQERDGLKRARKQKKREYYGNWTELGEREKQKKEGKNKKGAVGFEAREKKTRGGKQGA